MKAAVEAEKKAALGAEMDGFYDSTDSSYPHDVNSEDFLLEEQFMPNYSQLMSSCVSLT